MHKQFNSDQVLTIKVDLLAFNSIAACIDVFPLLLLNPSLGVSVCPIGVSFLFNTDLVVGVPRNIIIHVLSHQVQLVAPLCP